MLRQTAASLMIVAAVMLLPDVAQAESGSGQTEAMPMPDLTIYHLEGRRSERIVWLMEELELPYKLE